MVEWDQAKTKVRSCSVSGGKSADANQWAYVCIEQILSSCNKRASICIKPLWIFHHYWNLRTCTYQHSKQRWKSKDLVVAVVRAKRLRRPVPITSPQAALACRPLSLDGLFMEASYFTSHFGIRTHYWQEEGQLVQKVIVSTLRSDYVDYIWARQSFRVDSCGLELSELTPPPNILSYNDQAFVRKNYNEDEESWPLHCRIADSWRSVRVAACLTWSQTLLVEGIVAAACAWVSNTTVDAGTWENPHSNPM